MVKIAQAEYVNLLSKTADCIMEWQDRATQLHKALGLLLDSLGALSNPSELDGMGLTLEQQTYILAVHGSRGRAEEIA